MTLIAYALRRDSVDIVTDSIQYNEKTTNITYTGPKCRHYSLTLSDVAVACGGASIMAIAYTAAVEFATRDGSLSDIDDLAAWTPDIARACWEMSVERRTAIGCEHPDAGSRILAAGWSDRLGRIAAYEFWSFESEWHRGQPWGGTEIIGHLEMQRDMWAKAETAGFDLAKFDVVRSPSLPVDRHWSYGPFPAKKMTEPDQDAMPETDADWIAVAKRVRAEQIARPVENRTLLGGDVRRMTLTRDGMTERVIHAYDDEGEEWAALLAGTLNPDGAPYKWPGVGRNDPCPCASGKKYKLCHDPRALRSVA